MRGRLKDPSRMSSVPLLNTIHKLTTGKGYHVQVTARSDDDLQPDAIIRKVQDASGSKYSGGGEAPRPGGGPAPPVATKPVFMPSRVGGGGSFQPLGGGRSRQAAPSGPVDSDGWGDDAPPVTRSTLTSVESAYKPTKVNMNDLTSQKQEPSRFTPAASSTTAPDVVKGGYQPIGKVDIAQIRREAAAKGQSQDERPNIVKGSYEPVGKVDIAAIRAKAQAAPQSPAQTGGSGSGFTDDTPAPPKPVAERSAAFTDSGRLSSMPKPAPKKFGGASNFAGTKAPTPGGFGAKPVVPSAAPVGVASRTFADEGGKTPAQLWAEKKAAQGGGGAPAASTTGSAAPISSQTSGGWQSGYSGKKWGSVQTTHTGGVPVNAPGNEEDEQEPSGGVGSLRDRFKDTTISAAPEPPAMDMSSKPSAARAVPIPGMSRPAEEAQNVPPPPPQPPRTPTPEPEAEEDEQEHFRPASPIRIIQPVARTEEKPLEKAEAPPAMPVRSLAQQVPAEEHLPEEAPPVESSAAAPSGGIRAVVQYDYEKAEDNELELHEGDVVTNIELVDDDWWLGTCNGETGLFPSNYVERTEDEAEAAPAPPPAASRPVPPPAAPEPEPEPASAKSTATAEFDYEAAEDNELSFPEGATITDIEFVDESWWLGSCGGKTGLFPANYVSLHE